MTVADCGALLLSACENAARPGSGIHSVLFVVGTAKVTVHTFHPRLVPLSIVTCMQHLYANGLRPRHTANRATFSAGQPTTMLLTTVIARLDDDLYTMAILCASICKAFAPAPRPSPLPPSHPTQTPSTSAAASTTPSHRSADAQRAALGGARPIGSAGPLGLAWSRPQADSPAPGGDAKATTPGLRANGSGWSCLTLVPSTTPGRESKH